MANNDIIVSMGEDNEETVSGFFGNGSRFLSVIGPLNRALFAFSTYILSCSITNFAWYELEYSRCISVFTNIPRQD